MADKEPGEDYIKIDPRYQIRVTHRSVRLIPRERWWERLWLDLKWRLRRG